MITTNKTTDNRIFALRKNGMTYKKIADILNKEGIKTAHGLKWNSRNVNNRTTLKGSKTGKVKRKSSGMVTLSLNEVLSLKLPKKAKINLISKMI